MGDGRLSLSPLLGARRREGLDWRPDLHLGDVLSGHQKVIMDDGSELDFGPGNLVAIPPGHDGLVVGDEPCVSLDFSGMEHYAEGG